MSTVLITRPKADAAEFAGALTQLGLRAEFFPTIEISLLSGWALPDLEHYDGLIYTSKNAARGFLSELLSRAPNLLARLRATNHYAIGTKTNLALQAYGIHSALCSEKGNASDLADLLTRTGIEGKRFLFLRGTRSLGVIPEAINDKGGKCEELVVYETRDFSLERAHALFSLLSRADVTWVAFFSPSAVQSFFKALPTTSPRLRQYIAVIGSTTKDAVERFGYTAHAMPEIPIAEALARTIAKITSP